MNESPQPPVLKVRDLDLGVLFFIQIYLELFPEEGSETLCIRILSSAKESLLVDLRE